MGKRVVRIVPGVIALSVVLAVALSVSGLLVPASQRAALGASITVSLISGEATLDGPAGPMVIADGTVLHAGETIHTGADTRLVLTYFEGSTVEVEPSSTLTIDEASFGEGGTTLIRMTQLAGRTWHVVTKLVQSGSRYEVKTPTSTATVRGTEFQVDVAPSGDSHVATTEGAVATSDPSGMVEVVVTAGLETTVKAGETPAPPSRMPEPLRIVSVELDGGRSTVVDAFGRANGVDRNGKVVIQTPGAQVERTASGIVVRLPNPPSDRVTVVDHERQSGEQRVVTTVRDRGAAPVVTTTAGGASSAAVSSTTPEVRTIALPAIAAAPVAAPAAKSAGTASAAAASDTTSGGAVSARASASATASDSAKDAAVAATLRAANAVGATVVVADAVPAVDAGTKAAGSADVAGVKAVSVPASAIGRSSAPTSAGPTASTLKGEDAGEPIRTVRTGESRDGAKGKPSDGPVVAVSKDGPAPVVASRGESGPSVVTRSGDGPTAVVPSGTPETTAVAAAPRSESPVMAPPSTGGQTAQSESSSASARAIAERVVAEAAQAAQAARDAADRAKEAADRAKEAAERAKETAERAKETAERAKETAERAKETAERARESVTQRSERSNPRDN